MADELDIEKLKKWLGLTAQQCHLLLSVAALERRKIKPQVKDIASEHARLFHKDIQLPNVFALLRTLTEARLLIKEGRGRYCINSSGMRELLAGREADLKKELCDFKQVAENIDEYLQSLPDSHNKPVVEYLHGRKALFAKLNSQLLRAKKYYIVARFPGTAFTADVSRQGADRGEYQEILRERCLEKQELHITYITPLEIEYPFNYAMRLYHKRMLAEQECEQTIKRLQQQLKSCPALDIRRSQNPFGLDVVMTELERAEDFYLWVRDSDYTLSGAIHIYSADIAQQVKQHFLLAAQKAVKLDSRGLSLLIPAMRRKLQILGRKKR